VALDIYTYVKEDHRKFCAFLELLSKWIDGKNWPCGEMDKSTRLWWRREHVTAQTKLQHGLAVYVSGGRWWSFS